MNNTRKLVSALLALVLMPWMVAPTCESNAAETKSTSPYRRTVRVHLASPQLVLRGDWAKVAHCEYESRLSPGDIVEVGVDYLQYCFPGADTFVERYPLGIVGAVIWRGADVLRLEKRDDALLIVDRDGKMKRLVSLDIRTKRGQVELKRTQPGCEPEMVIGHASILHDQGVLASLIKRKIRALILYGTAELDPLSKLVNLERLELREHRLIKSLEFLEKLPLLKTLSVQGCCALESLDGVAKPKALEQVEVIDSPRLVRLGALSNALGLKRLTLDSCSALAKLDFLKGVEGLERLRVWRSRLLSLDGLKTMTGLRELDLAGCTTISDVKPIRLLSKLEFLDVSFLKCVTSLEVVSKLTNVRELRLDFCSNLVRVDSLQRLNNLESFSAMGTPRIRSWDALRGRAVLRFMRVDGDVLARSKMAEELPALRIVDVTGTKRHFSISSNALLSRLVSLNLDGCVGLRDVGFLRGCRNLKVLSMERCKSLLNTDVLALVPSLEVLNMSNCSKVKAFDNLGSLRKLRELLLRNSPGVNNLDFLHNMKALERLDVSDCEFLQDVKGLAALTTLRALGVNGVAGDYSFLARNPRMAWLRVGGGALETNGELAVLSRLSNMVFLDLGEQPVRDMSFLGKMKRLEALNLRSSSYLSDWSELSQCTSLVCLGLKRARTSTLGGGFSWVPVSRLENLRWLNAGHCNISNRDLTALTALSSLNYLWIHSNGRNLSYVPEIGNWKTLMEIVGDEERHPLCAGIRNLAPWILFSELKYRCLGP